jgi:hypothetical protein
MAKEIGQRVIIVLGNLEIAKNLATDNYITI